jgi:hypothetical protein
MPRLVATVMAEAVALDAFTNRWTAANMMELIMAPVMPAMLPRLAILTLYELDDQPGVFTERVRIIGADDAAIASSESHFNLPARGGPGALPSTHRSLHMLWGLQIPRYGEYRVVVERGDGEAPVPLNWTTLATRSLVVVEGQHPLQPVFTVQGQVAQPPHAGPAAPENRH